MFQRSNFSRRPGRDMELEHLREHDTGQLDGRDSPVSSIHSIETFSHHDLGGQTDYHSGHGVKSLDQNVHTKPFTQKDRKFPIFNGSNTRRDFWVPWSLRTSTICIFGVVFAAILASLEVIYHISQSHHGLGSPNSNEHYGWTYGPVAVFTIIAAFWSKLEYRVKQLVPWDELSRGRRTAAKSILLDYIGPWNVIAFFKSLTGRHFSVTLAITGSWLIKILIITSTGLFMLQAQSIKKADVPLLATDKFDPSGFNSSAQDTYPALSVNGVKRFGLPMLPGVVSDHVKSYAIQSFSATEPETGVTDSIGAIVDHFSADLDCEVAKVESTGTCDPRHCTSISYNVSATSSTCSLAKNLSLVFYPTQPYVNFANHYEVLCANTDQLADAYRWLLMVIQHGGGGYGASTPLGETVAMICKPTYQLQQSYATFNNDGSVDLASSNLTATSGAESVDFNTTDIARGIYASMGASSKAINSFTGSTSSGSSSDSSSGSTSRRDVFHLHAGLSPRNSPFSGWNWSNTQLSSQQYPKLDFGDFFYLMNATSPQADPAAFGDIELLNNTSRQTYSLMAAQMAKTRLMAAANESITGDLTLSDQRLIVRELSLRIMEAVLALMIILTIAIWFIAPRKVTSNDTSTLGGLGAVLARSTEFVKAMSSVGHLGISQLAAKICSREYQTLSESSGEQRIFMIHTDALSSKDSRHTKTNMNSTERIHRWEPIALTRFSRIGTLAITAAILIALEVIYQMSKKSDGISTIKSDGYVKYTWVYLPAFIMLLTRTLFDLIDVETRIMAPYHQMKTEPATASRTILVNYLSQMTPSVLFESIRNRHFAVTMTATTIFLSPFLTIVVSGLYTVEPTRFNHPVTIKVASEFNVSSKFSTFVDASGTQTSLLSSLILNSNLSFPAWTYDELTLPEFDVTTLASANNETMLPRENTTSLVIRAPVLRGSMNCTYSPKVYAGYSEFGGHEVNKVLIPIPVDDCETSTKGNATYSITASESLWYGGSRTSSTFYGNSKSNACPQLNVIWGHVSPSEHQTEEESSQNEDITGNLVDMQGAYCYPTIYSIETDITFSLPNFTVISAIPDEATAKLAVSRVNATISLSGILSEDIEDRNSHFSGGFPTLLKNKNVEEYLAKGNSEQVLDDLEHLYRVVMAQYLNLGARAKAPADQAPLTATLVESQRMRLKQNQPSTRILESLLATIIICVGITFLLVDTRYLLPAEPTSIAAMAVLLADSEIVTDEKMIPQGSEWCDQRELQRRGIFDGYMFSLGWWHKNGDGVRNFGIDVGKSQPNERSQYI